MYKAFFTFCFIIFFFFNEGYSQSTGNIPLKIKTKFNRQYGAADVWGVKINNINYALVTLDGGLSIVNTNNTSNPCETIHINHQDYHSLNKRLSIPDVETFTKDGITYAYLATYNTIDPNMPLVMIININAALAFATTCNPCDPNNPCEILIDPYNPSGSVYVGKIDDFWEINVSHTLTIEDGFLYVATLNQNLPVWYLRETPANPALVSIVTNNTPYAELHEMKVISNSPNTATVYAAFLRGGLKVYNLIFNPSDDGPPSLTISSTSTQLYDADRAYPNQIESGDLLFNYRLTHSAFPSVNGQYIFTTDELTVWPPNYSNQYSGEDPELHNPVPPNPSFKTPRRIGAFLRVWDANNLGQSNALKGGYYVSEEHHWGITDLAQIDTNWVPNSIHQMHIKGNKMYVAHYTQGFRYLDISNPENIIELGWYDDTPSISFNPASSMFFRKWATGMPGDPQKFHMGIYGVFPDPNRSTVCYGGGFDGLYIFDLTAIPYPPTNLAATPNNNGHYVLSWNPSPALNARYYHIYRAAVPCCEPYDLPLYATINAYQGGNPVTSWEDVNSRVGSGDGTYYYEISIENTVGKHSVHSNRVAVGIGQPSKRTAEDEETKEQTEKFEYFLSDNYPNPFNPTTTFEYSIKSPGLVTLKVYDILGTEVASLVNERKEPGNYSVAFNATKLPSGMYVYRLTADKFVETKKLILLK